MHWLSKTGEPFSEIPSPKYIVVSWYVLHPQFWQSHVKYISYNTLHPIQIFLKIHDTPWDVFHPCWSATFISIVHFSINSQMKTFKEKYITNWDILLEAEVKLDV